jgi:formate hydrogenlyase subunit 3/multisubunit Na+/H+ antiporter MnhD subunit
MTKVGVYAILRLWTLLFSSEAGDRPCSAASG